MTDHTTLTHRFVLVNERAALRGVAFEANLVLTQESKATGFEYLLNVCLCTFDSNPGVRIMTISAADFAFRHWMMVGQLKRCANFQVTLETSLRGPARIDNSVCSTAAFDM